MKYAFGGSLAVAIHLDKEMLTSSAFGRAALILNEKLTNVVDRNCCARVHILYCVSAGRKCGYGQLGGCISRIDVEAFYLDSLK